MTGLRSITTGISTPKYKHNTGLTDQRDSVYEKMDQDTNLDEDMEEFLKLVRKIAFSMTGLLCQGGVC